MGDYNRTIWKDHIKDQIGNVIQQGTPVSAKNLNNIENQIVSLSAKENILAELVRESIPSGFTTLSDLDFAIMSTTPNTIKLLKDNVAYVNGYKVTIPAGTTITLNAPPTSGIREDLVFLEVWKQADANGAEQLNWRIRIVDGVDFNTYPEGINNTASAYSNATLAKPQGALLQPNGTTAWNMNFLSLTQRNQVVNSGWSDATKVPVASQDAGVYIAGAGTVSIGAWNTTDGYVYAIPMFRVKRRNSRGYSAVNANGSVNYFAPLFSARNVLSYFGVTGGDTSIWTLSNTADYESINIGDIFSFGDLSTKFKVICKNGSNSVTMQLNYNKNGSGLLTLVGATSAYFRINNTPPNGFMANIIVDRDIIDLRHLVSLTGFNYQALLEESFDILLRGELQTTDKTKMLKTYHGLAKTPIDANHVFYASMDGTTVAEVGGAPTDSYGSGNSFVPAITGLGVICPNRARDYALVGQLTDSVTIDCIAPFNGSMPNGNHIIYSLLDSNGNELLRFSFKNGDNGTVSIINGSNQGWWSAAPIGKHYRLVINSTNISIYVDGKLKNTWAKSSSVFSTLNVASIVKVRIGSQYVYELNYISDFSISNIDRGSVFATLPQDFIDGYARIAPAFNSQRNVFSDALTSEAPLAQVKCAGGNNKEITLGDSTDWIKDDGTKWNTGDRIKIKGLGGEIITGVIDADTALAKSTNGQTFVGTGLYTVNIDDTNKFIIGDTFTIANSTGGIWTKGASIIIGTITAIDTVNKILTFTTNLSINNYVLGNGDLLCEITASSSSPTVKANLTGTAQAGAANTVTLPSAFSATDSAYNGLTLTITGGTGAGQVRTISGYVGSTKVATVNSAWVTNPDSTSVFLITGVPIVGTWSGLGTNEATFTLSANSDLVAQDLWINYSLNEVVGQGGISEVLTATLAGESNGKKLVVNPSVHIRDDYAGKVSGSVTVNPNIAKYIHYNTLISPSNGTELMQGYYDAIKTLDGSTSSMGTTTANGEMAQHLFSFNLIRIVEDKYGKLPCPDDTASKVAWLKANVNRILFNWWGYGSCPSGNKAIISGLRASTNVWNYFNYAVNTNIPSLITCNTNDNSIISSMIDQNGFVHFLAYTDASDGVTASTIYTDYCNIELVLLTPTGYDVLAPENPRRDDGKGNILLVRKETKEIQTMFSRANTDGVVTYGDYVPYQGNNKIFSGTAKIMAMAKGLLTTLGTGFVGKSGLPQTHNLPSNRKDYEFIPYTLYMASDGVNIEHCKCETILKQFSATPSYPLFYSVIGRPLSIAYNATAERGYKNSYQSTANVWDIAIKELIDNPKWSSYTKVAVPILINANGSLLLYIQILDKKDVATNSGDVFDIIPLNNRPLIK